MASALIVAVAVTAGCAPPPRRAGTPTQPLDAATAPLAACDCRRAAVPVHYVIDTHATGSTAADAPACPKTALEV
jgi:hypothetical protein